MEIEDVFKKLKDQYNYKEYNWFHFTYENPKPFVEAALKYVLKEYVWLPEYDEVVDWMKDNKGKGLILLGKNGLGKTIFAKHIIPAFFFECLSISIFYNSIYTINDGIDRILGYRRFIIDDVGCEGQKVDFGERRWAFPEILDSVEQHKKFIVITSNLTPQAFEEKYGVRTRDRIKACCHQITFKGESLRK
jgi:DNA replication protein DnaC